MSPLDWSNTRRTWDGVVLAGKTEDWNVDLFLTQFVPVQKYEFNERDEDQNFYGAYAVNTALVPSQTLDVYWLGRELATEDRYSAGTRVGGPWTDTGLDSDLELTLQYGDAGETDIDAYSVSAVLGYTPADVAFKPRVYAGYDYASGDKNPEDDKAGTFNQLYPLGHLYLGYIDAVGRQNIQDLSLGVSAWPKAAVVLCKLEGHAFRRAEATDALYNAGGGVVRAGDSGDSRDVGTELDLLVQWMVNPETVVLGGYSHFFAGDFIGESGPSSDIDFAYASVQYTF